jgi:hypothetical protein
MGRFRSRSTTIPYPLGVDQHIGDVLDIAHLPFAVAGIGSEPITLRL